METFEPVEYEYENEEEIKDNPINVKIEKSQLDERVNNSNVSFNPWDVLTVETFLKYCCPECEFNSNELFSFSQHALTNHVLSNIL